MQHASAPATTPLNIGSSQRKAWGDLKLLLTHAWWRSRLILMQDKQWPTTKPGLALDLQP